MLIVARNITSPPAMWSRHSTPWLPSVAPRAVRSDNGPEITAHALRPWGEGSGTATVFIGLGAPWQNQYVEDFYSRLRDEVVTPGEFCCGAEVQILLADWQA